MFIADQRKQIPGSLIRESLFPRNMLEELHWRKLILAKCKNFANLPIHESYFPRKFLPLKYYATSPKITPKRAGVKRAVKVVLKNPPNLNDLNDKWESKTSYRVRVLYVTNSLINIFVILNTIHAP